MSAIPADLRTTSPWRTALPAVLALVAAILLLYRETAITMVGVWYRSETFAHAFLVLPISLWLIWRQREPLAALTPRAQPWMLLPMLGVAAVWLMADLVVVNAASQFALVALLVLAVPAVLGFQVTMVILFPLLFLFFAVPFGEFMLPPMMEWTADFTVAALQLTGIPVYREGLQFVIPTGSWSVIDECSGVRYLIASFMVGSLFAYLNYRSYKRRVVFMLFSIAVPIVANWLRAYLIVMTGHLSGNKLAVGADHILYGWVFFGIVIFIMFIVGSRWSEPDEPRAATAGQRGLTHAATEAAARPMVATLLAGMVVVLAPHLALGALERSERAAAPAQLELPRQLAPGWAADDIELSAWTPLFANPSLEVTQAYTGPAGTVGVYMAYYRGQTYDRKLVSGQNGFVSLNDRRWKAVGAGTRDVDADGQTITLRTAEIIDSNQPLGEKRMRLVAWRVYWIDGRFIAGDAAGKVANAVARLRGHGDEGAGLVLYARGETTAAAQATLEAFVKANLAPLNELLQRTHDAR
jgi:exosortase A